MDAKQVEKEIKSIRQEMEYIIKRYEPMATHFYNYIETQKQENQQESEKTGTTRGVYG